MGLSLATHSIFNIQQTDNAGWTHKSNIQSTQLISERKKCRLEANLKVQF